MIRVGLVFLVASVALVGCGSGDDASESSSAPSTNQVEQCATPDVATAVPDGAQQGGIVLDPPRDLFVQFSSPADVKLAIQAHTRQLRQSPTYRSKVVGVGLIPSDSWLVVQFQTSAKLESTYCEVLSTIEGAQPGQILVTKTGG